MSDEPIEEKSSNMAMLIVSLVIVGILVFTAVPVYIKDQERAKFSEARAWLESVRAAQERYEARMGTFSASMQSLDATLLPPKYFSPEGLRVMKPMALSTRETQRWRVSLRRRPSSDGSCPQPYGCYLLTYTSPPATLECDDPDCAAELLPAQ